MKEIRVSTIQAETRSTDTAASEDLVLYGRPICYDTPTTIRDAAGYAYVEVIKRGALDNADLSDVRLLVNHDVSKIPLARTPKTMSLNVDAAGLTFEATLPDTEEARSAYTAVKRGDITGMSFAFKVPEGGDSFDPETNTRTIFRIEKVYECSIVNFPAYPTTSCEARAAQAGSLDRYKAKQRAKILINQILTRRV